MSSLDCLDLCRLCLVKDSVSVPIFGGEGDARQIFLKIAACLPVKVARDDKLPKKICDQCVCKIELCYEFWNTTVNSEKQLIEWLGGSGVEDKQNYVSDVLNPNIMKQEQSNENRLDGTVMQVSGHQSNMAIGMMGNLALNMPIIISTSSQQQISSVPMDTSCNSVQAAQPLPGPSSQTSHSQNQVNSVGQEEEESTEEDDNTDDDGDAEEGLPVKEESEEDVNTNRSIEPTTFVNVSLACDEAGPSGLQQQKISEMPEMTISQTTDGDPKSGFPALVLLDQKYVVEKNSAKQASNKTVPNFNCQNLQSNSFQSSIMKDVPILKSIVSNIESDFKNEPLKFKSEDCEEKDDSVLLEITQVKTEKVEETTICIWCQKIFDSVHDLEYHLKEPPVKGKHIRYKCAFCCQSLRTLGALKIHVKKHTQVLEKPFKKITNFKNKTNFKYKCVICNATFKSEAGFKKHLETHTLASCFCDFCGKSFQNQHFLQQHSCSFLLNNSTFENKDIEEKKGIAEEVMMNVDSIVQDITEYYYHRKDESVLENTDENQDMGKDELYKHTCI